MMEGFIALQDMAQMTATFFDLSLYQESGVSGVFRGLPPVESLAEIVDGFERGVAATAPSLHSPFQQGAKSLKEMLALSATPEEFVSAQGEVANVLARLEGKGTMGRVIDATGWRHYSEYVRERQKGIPLSAKRALPRVQAQALAQLSNLARFARIISPSRKETLPNTEVRFTIPFVKRAMEQVGFRVQEQRMIGANPLLTANISGKSSRTILLVTHYDTPPISSDDVGDPQRIVISDSAIFGHGIVSKGGLMAVLGAVAAFRLSNQELPVSIRLVATGEGAIGSPNAHLYIDSLWENRNFDMAMELYGTHYGTDGEDPAPFLFRRQFRERRNGNGLVEENMVLNALNITGSEDRERIQSLTSGSLFLENLFDRVGPYPAFSLNMALADSEVGEPMENLNIPHFLGVTRFLTILFALLG